MLVVIVAVASLLQCTRIGKAMRAVSDNPDLAASSGIDVDRVDPVRLGARRRRWPRLGGILFGVQQQVQFEMGFQLLLLMFAGITLGGLGTAYGALVGLASWSGSSSSCRRSGSPPSSRTSARSRILIVVLLVRPQGILGTAERIG